MTPEEAVRQLREELDDLEPEYLWATHELYRYLERGQAKFAERTDVLASRLLVPVAEGDPELYLNPAITKIRGAKLVAEDRSLNVMTIAQYEISPAHDDYGLQRTTAWESNTGTPRVLLTDYAKNIGYLTPYYPGIAESTLAAGVALGSTDIELQPGDSADLPAFPCLLRLGSAELNEVVTASGVAGDVVMVSPLAKNWAAGTPVRVVTGKVVALDVYHRPFTRPGPETAFAVSDPDHVEAVIVYAKYLAYSKQDADAHNPKGATEALQRYDELVREAKWAIKRTRKPPGTVRYGGL